MRGKSILLIGLLFAATACAQGTFLYTWHGDSGLFHASFQVTAEENQPGQYFESQTFYASIRFVSPDDTFTYTYFTGPGLHDVAEGRTGPNAFLDFILYDNALQRELDAGANSSWALISEWDQQSNTQLWYENGYWTSTSVPEPSIVSLTLTGVPTVFWFAARRRATLSRALGAMK